MAYFAGSLDSNITLLYFVVVDSNDVLYASDSQFHVEINFLCSSILEEILKYAKILDTSGLIKSEVRSVARGLFGD